MMFLFHINGFEACYKKYYYDKDRPVDISVNAETKSEAITKAEKALECTIHRDTMRVTADEVRDSLNATPCKEPSSYIRRAAAMEICHKVGRECFESSDARGQNVAEKIEDAIAALPAAE